MNRTPKTRAGVRRAKTGLPVLFGGLVYVITKLNEYGMYNLIRFDARRRMWQRTSASKERVRSLGKAADGWRRRLKYALLAWDRLNHWTESRSKTAAAWRRAQRSRAVLKRFFTRVQSRPCA